MNPLKYFLCLCLVLTQVSFANTTQNDYDTVYTLDPATEAVVDSLANPLIASIKASKIFRSLSDEDAGKMKKTLHYGKIEENNDYTFNNKLRELIDKRTAEEVNIYLDLALVKVLLSEVGIALTENDEFRVNVEAKIQNLIATSSNGSVWKRVRNGALIGAAVGFVIGVVYLNSTKNNISHYRGTGKDFFGVFLTLAVAGGLIGWGVHGIASLATDDVKTIDLLKIIEENPHLEAAVMAHSN